MLNSIPSINRRSVQEKSGDIMDSVTEEMSGQQYNGKINNKKFKSKFSKRKIR